MRTLALAVSLVALATSASAGIIVERKDFAVPEYASIQGIERYAAKDEYEAAQTDKRFRLEKLTYLSDGLRVHAYLYAPVKPANGMPAVIYNRDSFTRTEFADDLLTLFHRLGQAGFVVIAPMYRQSGGAEGRDEMGGADLADLMNVRTLAEELGFVDMRNLFMFGESRGGMMTFQAIRDGFPVRAAATFGAFTDLGAYFSEMPQLASMAPKIWPAYETESAAIHEKRSAVAWADKLNVPLLIMHGGSDQSVSPSHALALAAKLQELNQPYELIVRVGANHVLTQWREERDQHAVDWFRRHMAK